MPDKIKHLKLQDTGFWKAKKVLLTGGHGFLGRHLKARLETFGAVVAAPRRNEYNLTSMDMVMRCFSHHRPEMVIHSAAYYGGLGITMSEPGKIYYENLVMGAHMMEAARLHDVKKFVAVGTACSYPGHLENQLRESDLWAGPLHDSVIAYGSVKKMMAIQGMAYHRQFGFNSIHLIPSNLYGPHDCFDDYRSHVVGALVRKFWQAHTQGGDVSLWGSGNPVREFLFVEDCADGILLAAEKYNEVSPLNIGNGVGTSIRELAETISELLSFQGRLVWDTAKPDGQLMKILDVTHMKKVLGWAPQYSLRDGLERTLRWYHEHVGATAHARATKKAA